jgi:hypothetical protein
MILSGIFLYLAVILGKLGSKELGLILMCPVVPALIAGAGTLWATRRVVNWYYRNVNGINNKVQDVT